MLAGSIQGLQHSVRSPASGCLHSRFLSGQQIQKHEGLKQRSCERVAARANVQEAQTIAPVYAAAWVAKAREDKSLRRAFEDVKALRYALTADAGAAASQNGASNGDSAIEGEVNESFLGVLSQLQLDDGAAVQGSSGEVQDYVVGELAYGEADHSTYVPDIDPADVEDEGDTTSGLYSLLINPVLPLNAKMHVLSKLKQELGLKSLTLKFLQLLIVESRITALPGVLDSFETLFNDAINLQIANVRAAAPLDAEDQFAIAKIVQGRSGRRHVRVKVEIDDSLLAGFIVEFNYETLDFSVKAAISDAVSRTAEALGVEMAI